MSSALTRRKLSVATFESAAQFLAEVDPDRPGCLLLDLSMPEMDGLQLQQELSQRGITLPIIFITGQGDIPNSVRAIKAGALDFMEKPFRLEALLQRINEAFAADAGAREARQRQEEDRSRFQRLTPRELDVMKAMIAGAATSKEVAKDLGISNRTVDHHRARIMEKTGARSVAELASLAARSKITHDD
ncbi:MAG: response regulator [Gammaproteobacteria bacterium]|nr:response regulator [Gammaproteobacteria bacterium]NNF59713.1 response regulator transcription factor [Gammaproteobacteria bacterium]